MPDLEQLAQRLDDAARNAKAIAQLSTSGNALNLTQAYAVQAQSIQHRVARGEKLVGVKMGFTSRAKMEQMGVNDLIWGRLTNQMEFLDGSEVHLNRFIHPRVEPEVAFRLARPLSGCANLAEVMSAIDAVAPALEIIDSRYDNFKFSLEDVVADNSSSSAFVVGPWQAPDLDLSNLGMCLEFNGEAVQVGSSAAILGNPWRSVVEASRLANDAGLTLESGWIILAGAATAAQALPPGTHVRVNTQQLGSAEIRTAQQGKGT